MLNADGSFTYTPKPGYISNGSDPENGTPNDRFTYQLTGPNGTSTNAVVEIAVAAPTVPTVDTPTAANVTATTATLGGNVSSDGGAAITAVGVVFAPTAIDANPQLGDTAAGTATGAGSTGVFTVNVSGLAPGTDYSYAAYATNSLGVGYSLTGSFTTLATFQSWQQTWFGASTNSGADLNADPYNTGVQNIAVFAFIGPYQDPSTASIAQTPADSDQRRQSFLQLHRTRRGKRHHLWRAVEYHAATQRLARNHRYRRHLHHASGHLFSAPMTNTQVFMRLTATVH